MSMLDNDRVRRLSFTSMTQEDANQAQKNRLEEVSPQTASFFVDNKGVVDKDARIGNINLSDHSRSE